MNAYEKYFATDVLLISEALKTIDVNEMEKLINQCEIVMKRGHKIIASGLGKNVPICDKFVGTMLSLGLNANFLHTNTAVHGDMGMVKPGDLVIILTKSGATAESVYLVQLLKQRRGVKLWLLSFEENSILANEVRDRLIIHLKHEGDLWNIIPNHSTTINLIILQKIAIELSKRMNLSLENDFKPNHPGGIIGEILK